MARMKFIPELREHLEMHLRQIGLSDNIINNAFANWDADREPANVWEQGAFEVFRKAQDDVDKPHED